MNPLVLQKTEDTLEVILDKKGNEFSFTGTSIPENTNKFFQPILDWVEKYTQNPNDETIVSFKIKYCNTSSTKSLHDIMIKFTNISKMKEMLIINWYFNEEDEDMFEAGKELSTEVNFPFNYIKQQI